IHREKRAMTLSEPVELCVDDPIIEPGVAIGVVDVDVIDNGLVPVAAPGAPAVPGMPGLKRRERGPADVPETDSNVDSAAKPEERNQRRTPIVPLRARAGPPAPAIASVPEPAAVVIWRPTPGVVTDPGPAVVVFPNPPARAIRSPIRGHTRSPNVAIGRGDPGAIRVQVFGAVYIGRYILITARAKQILVAIVIPVVELIARNRGFHLKLGVRLGAASEHGPAGGKCLRSPR